MEEETSTEVIPEQAAKETDTNSNATFNEDSKELEDNIFELYRYLFVKKKMFNYSDLHFFEVTKYLQNPYFRGQPISRRRNC